MWLSPDVEDILSFHARLKGKKNLEFVGKKRQTGVGSGAERRHFI